MKHTAKFEHGGNIHQALAACKGNRILDFSANINPLGLSPRVEAAIREAVASIIHYPDPAGTALKRAIADHYGVEEAHITLGNGAVELLYVLCHALRPKRALIPSPAFSEYERAATAAGAEILYHIASEDDAFRLRLDKLYRYAENADIVFIGNPNNPTGTLLDSGELESLIAHAETKKCFVLIDESFLDFLPDGERYTCRHLVSRFDNLMILHSLTKFYAIPGLRLGFGLTNPALAEKMRLAKDPWNVNALAQRAGIAALGDAAYQEKSRAFLADEKIYFYAQLARIRGFTPYAPSVNFILVRLDRTVWQAKALRAALSEEGVLIRDCGNYPGLDDRFVRFAVKNHAENQICIQCLKNLKMDGENDDENYINSPW